MLITVDARTVFDHARRGTGKNLIDLYRRAAAIRPDWRFVMYHRSKDAEDPFGDLANVENRRIEIKGDRFNLWQQIRLPVAAKMAGADLLHCPANTGPKWPLVPMVLTIHDLIPLDPRFATAQSRRWGRNVAKAAKKARRIITPSEFSKRQVIETFGVPADKIIVNHWAPVEGYGKVTDIGDLNRVRFKYGLEPDRPYVFGLGGADPRKNTERIINAWAFLTPKLRSEYALVMVGINEPLLGKLRQQAANLGLDGSCFLNGFAAEGDMAALLSGAVALCYPSLSEGFGLPVLDAFACETAVLTSNTTSLPEVAGEAALLVDPCDTKEIANALYRLLTDENLRADLVVRGTERIKRFTWQACAERICGVFDELLREVD